MPPPELVGEYAEAEAADHQADHEETADITCIFSDPFIAYRPKKRLTVFPPPDGVSHTKLSLAGNILFIPGPESLHCKKRLAVFPSPAGMSLTKLSLDGKN